VVVLEEFDDVRHVMSVPATPASKRQGLSCRHGHCA
jgi:hypothetical protein